MTKTNVFLLVVVSSLLTYISTASSPAATAAVAQEKWEFGKSCVTRTPGGGTSFRFLPIQTAERNWKNNRDVWMTAGDTESGWAVGHRITSAPSVTKREIDAAEASNIFDIKSRELVILLSEQGWHPYQISDDGDKRIEDRLLLQGMVGNKLEDQLFSTIYWRRRVQ